MTPQKRIQDQIRENNQILKFIKIIYLYKFTKKS